MTEHFPRRRWLCVLPLLVWNLGACAGKAGPSEATGGVSAGGSSAAGGAATVGGAASTGGTANPGGSATTDKSCAQDTDCTWTEISVEILKPADCICVYGCPYIITNKSTADRRTLQYLANCDSSHDGKGALCGIDDCMMPPALSCLDGTCTARE